MPIWTRTLATVRPIGATKILGMGDGFQMQRDYTGRPSTKMIRFQASGDEPYQRLICEPVRWPIPPVYAKLAVSLAILRPHPLPAPIFKDTHLRPEARG